MSDLGGWYRKARLRIAALVDESVAARPVPATPQWSVHDVIAHLAGICEDAVSGNMHGVTTDPWTAAQVERGRGRSTAELFAVWDEYAPLVEANLSSPTGSRSYTAVIDICTHEADVRQALGMGVEVPVDVLAWAAAILRSTFAAGVAEAGIDAVEVQASDFEWFRGRLGRRTVDEVCAYCWSADPAPYLEHWFVFGRAEHSLGEIDPAARA